MIIRLGYDLVFEAPAPTPMLLLLSTHPSRGASHIRPDNLSIEPVVRRDDFLDRFGNRCTRVLTPAGQVRFWNDTLVEDSGQPDFIQPNAVQLAVGDLPPDVLPYLLASRYCEVDCLSDVAWNLFSGAPMGWGRVQTICDWVHNNVRFGYGFARSTKTAQDVYNERAGVCRDFTHLAITFCRCMNIPARYATGYLGDIGVPISNAPMDFSAWFEAYLGGQWYTFDARHNIPRIGRVLMAYGRDAADAALTTSFGPTALTQFKVWTDEVVGSNAAGNLS